MTGRAISVAELTAAYPGHTVASGAQDVRAIAEALGHDRLGIWGRIGWFLFSTASGWPPAFLARKLRYVTTTAT
jgi:hypothetical protein